MDRAVIFVILSIPIVIVSWRTLLNFKSHGFYRFFAWECMAWLFVTNYKYWFDDPFAIKQLFSWTFLLIAGYLVIVGVILLKRLGKPEKNRSNSTLYQFEQTTQLIDTGIYKYIRHPLYSSLLFLTWGVFLKNPTFELSLVALLSTVLIYIAAIFDERECSIYFGNKYAEYMKRSKRFIPFVI